MMEIGIIFYSQTGNTAIVAQKLLEKFKDGGYAASLEQITISGNTPAQPGKFELTDLPRVEEYDAIVLGSPVQAFALNPVMKAYLATLPVMAEQKAACFVTKQLPLFKTGGTQAIKYMEKTCASKGMVIVRSEIVVWSKGKNRDQSICHAVENLSHAVLSSLLTLDNGPVGC